MLRGVTLASVALLLSTGFLFVTPTSGPPVSDPIRQVHSGDNRSVNTTVLAGGRTKDIAPRGGSVDTSTSSADSGTVDPCWYYSVPVENGDSRIEGDDPSKGVLYLVSCPDAISLATGNLIFSNQGYIWVRNGSPVVAPPPSPQLVAEQARGTITVPDPRMHLGPDDTKIAVKVPVWLWVEPEVPLMNTLTVRGLSVTVVATLSSTTWSMGEIGNPTTSSAVVAAFICTGAGTRAPTVDDGHSRPPCGYTYSWKSLIARTGGMGTWPVTVTTSWDVTWTASNGAAGKLEPPLTSTPRRKNVAVGEWRSSLRSGTG
jgi:hypothetical protein